MLTKVEVDNLQGQTLSLPLDDISGGYVVKDIAGLDPVKATITSSAFAQLDGSTPQGARRENRNVVMRVGIEPDYAVTSVSDLRRELYAFFMPKTNVEMRYFMDDVLFASASGQVESCEATPFSKEPEANVSIICFDPNFTGPTAIILEGDTVEDATETTIEYEGTVETGFVFRLLLDRSESDFTIYNRRPNGEVQSLNVTTAMVATDVVEISTRSRNKYATLNGNSILYAVDKLSNWMPLYPGDNFFRVLASGAAIPWELEYVPKYGGL